jgi:ABC-2 type transport system permease protein
MSELAFQAHAAWVVAKKNARVYYLKPPVFTFGLIFPFFFYVAFAAGHDAPARTLAPGIVSMALFFTASAVGPLVTPWERQARTYERLATSPASLIAILAGDVLAGAAFGMLLVPFPLILVVLFTGATIASIAPLAAGIAVGAIAFSTLGVLLAAPATTGPSQVMMLSNLVRLPLIFVSGVFMPFAAMPGWGRRLAPFSPLSYASDLVRMGFGEVGYWSVFEDIAALLAFAAGFLLLAYRFHLRSRERAL